MRPRYNLEIWPLSRRLEIGAGGGGAISVADGVLATPKTFLLLAVIVIGHGEAGRERGLHPRVVERVGSSGEFRADRSCAAAPTILPAFPSLAALEVGQHIGIGPAARALLRPAVVIAAMAARVSHHVDRGRSAQHLAAHGFDLAAIHVRLGLGGIAPVEHVV